MKSRIEFETAGERIFAAIISGQTSWNARFRYHPVSDKMPDERPHFVSMKYIFRLIIIIFLSCNGNRPKNPKNVKIAIRGEETFQECVKSITHNYLRSPYRPHQSCPEYELHSKPFTMSYSPIMSLALPSNSAIGMPRIFMI